MLSQGRIPRGSIQSKAQEKIQHRRSFLLVGGPTQVSCTVYVMYYYYVIYLTLLQHFMLLSNTFFLVYSYVVHLVSFPFLNHVYIVHFSISCFNWLFPSFFIERLLFNFFLKLYSRMISFFFPNFSVSILFFIFYIFTKYFQTLKASCRQAWYMVAIGVMS